MYRCPPLSHLRPPLPPTSKWGVPRGPLFRSPKHRPHRGCSLWLLETHSFCARQLCLFCTGLFVAIRLRLSLLFAYLFDFECARFVQSQHSTTDSTWIAQGQREIIFGTVAPIFGGTPKTRSACVCLSCAVPNLDPYHGHSLVFSSSLIQSRNSIRVLQKVSECVCYWDIGLLGRDAMWLFGQTNGQIEIFFIDILSPSAVVERVIWLAVRDRAVS